MNRQELRFEIARLIHTSRCSSTAILASPGAASEEFLGSLSADIEHGVHKAMAFGPVDLSIWSDRTNYRRWLIGELSAAGILQLTNEEDEYVSAASESLFWARVKLGMALAAVNVVVITISGVHITADEAGLYDFYAGLRKFCSEWRDPDLAVHHISVGTWAPHTLERAFFQRQTSWPFVAGHNLFFLPDFTVVELADRMARRFGSTTPKPIHALYLWELTRGDPNATDEILRRLTEALPTCDTMYAAAAQLVESAQYAKTMRSQVQMLSLNARQLLGFMLEGQLVGSSCLPTNRDELLLSGLVRFGSSADDEYGRFRNWVVESTIRKHWRYFRELIPASPYTDYTELIPTVNCLNEQAYSLICEIENLLRNLVLLRLSHYGPQRQHPLMGVFTSQRRGNQAQTGQPLKDEYHRAQEWYQDRVAGSPFVDAHAALIGYSQTAHLLELVDRLIHHDKDPIVARLLPLRTDLDALKDIRDAVAHNQLISETSYYQLHHIRTVLQQALVIQPQAQ